MCFLNIFLGVELWIEGDFTIRGVFLFVLVCSPKRGGCRFRSRKMKTNKMGLFCFYVLKVFMGQGFSRSWVCSLF